MPYLREASRINASSCSRVFLLLLLLLEEEWAWCWSRPNWMDFLVLLVGVPGCFNRLLLLALPGLIELEDRVGLTDDVVWLR